MKRFVEILCLSSIVCGAAFGDVVDVDVSWNSWYYGHKDGGVKVPGTPFFDCPDFGSQHTVEQREKTRAMGQLAADSYKDGKAQPPEGYATIKDRESFEAIVGKDSGFELGPDGTIYRADDPGGFNAVLYRGPDGNVVLAFRGTEFTQPSDVAADRDQLAGKLPRQYQDASILLGLVLKNVDGHVDVTGHSLGGGEVQYALMTNELEGRVSGYTFNSAGLSDKVFYSVDERKRILAGIRLTNVRQDGDPVSAVGWHLGDIYQVPDHDGSLFDHPIGDIVGYDQDGNPVYDGLLGNIWRDGHPGSSPPKNLVSLEEFAARALVAASGSSADVAEPMCKCAASVAFLKERRELADNLRKAIFEYNTAKAKKEGAVAKLVAEALEPIPDLCEWLAGVLVGEWGEQAIAWLNTGARYVFGQSVSGDELARQIKATAKTAAEGSSIDPALLDATFADDDEGTLDSVLGWVGEKVPGTKGALNALKMIKKALGRLKAVWDKGVSLGEDAFGIVAANRELDKARNTLRELAVEANRKAAKWAEFDANGGCSCASGCQCACPHCKPEEPGDGGEPGDETGGGDEPGDGTGGGTGGGGGGGTGGSGGEEGGGTGGGDDRDIIDEWIAGAGSAGEDPWAPIRAGISRDGSVSSGSLLVPDVIGLGAFTKILDEADEIAKWSDAATAWGDVAGGLWGAVAGGGDGSGSAIETVVNEVAKWGDSWFDRFVKRMTDPIADWIRDHVAGVVKKIEALVEKANKALDGANEKMKGWVARNVSKWIETMRDYSKSVQEERGVDPLRDWTTVDYGHDGPVDVDVNAAPRTERRQGYRETVSP